MSEVSTETIKIIVGDLETGAHSFTWRFWAAKTSFYIKCPGPGFDLKFSLHGPDPRHSWHGFKLAWDGDTNSPETIAIARAGWLPVIFPGHQVDTGRELVSKLVLRLRMPWDIFDHPPALAPARLRNSDKGLRISTPPLLRSADIDVYVSEGEPFWPYEAQVKADNSAIGPLKNAAGQYLTAVSLQRPMFDYPTPDRAVGVGPRDRSDAVRGTGGCLDDQGFMWVVEQWLSRAALDARTVSLGRRTSAVQRHSLESGLLRQPRLRDHASRTWWGGPANP